MIAEVIVDIASSETDKVFDYLCDDSLTAGARVRAPFGARTLPGFVVRLKEQSDYPLEKLKKVEMEQADELPALTKECLLLAQKIASRYRVPLALSLRLFLPSEMRTGKVRELVKRFASPTMPFAEMSFPKSAKILIPAASFLSEHGKTECSA